MIDQRERLRCDLSLSEAGLFITPTPMLVDLSHATAGKRHQFEPTARKLQLARLLFASRWRPDTLRPRAQLGTL